MRLEYHKSSTRIWDSYLLKNDELDEVVNEIMESRLLMRYPVTRCHNDYVREIKAHNRLYKMGLFRSHTKDTDLEENIKRYKKIIYSILGV